MADDQLSASFQAITIDALSRAFVRLADGRDTEPTAAERTFLTSNCRHIETTVGVQTGSMSLAAMNTSAAEPATEYVVPRY